MLTPVGLCFALVIAGCGSEHAGHSFRSQRVDQLLGDRAVSVLKSADRVEIYRVEDRHLPPSGKNEIGGYPILERGEDQGPAFARNLAKVLLDDGSYEWEMAKGCTFDPGLACRVWSGKESILVLVCFHCDEVAIIPDEAHSDVRRYGESDPARPALLRLAKAALPHDREIQELKAN